MAKANKKTRKPKASPATDVPPPQDPQPVITQPGPPRGVTSSPGGPTAFKAPDPEKPIRDILNVNGAPVGVTIIDGRLVRGLKTALVFVQNGQSSELLTTEQAKLKFVQDIDGNVFYGSHGFSIPPANTKPVDVVELAS